jgi:cell fate (sporulation/competence/biofilm development) regulator YmcA (YheA/YmcA/DUF963 family)
MEILELSAQIGQLLKDDERVVNYLKAREVFENDETLQELINEYNTQNLALKEEDEKLEPDVTIIDIIEGRIDELYDQINANDIYTEYHESLDLFNEVLRTIHSEIMFNATGERPHSCDDEDCEECGGCH